MKLIWGKCFASDLGWSKELRITKNYIVQSSFVEVYIASSLKKLFGSTFVNLRVVGLSFWSAQVHIYITITTRLYQDFLMI